MMLVIHRIVIKKRLKFLILFLCLISFYCAVYGFSLNFASTDKAEGEYWLNKALRLYYSYPLNENFSSNYDSSLFYLQKAKYIYAKGVSEFSNLEKTRLAKLLFIENYLIRIFFSDRRRTIPSISTYQSSLQRLDSLITLAQRLPDSDTLLCKLYRTQGDILVEYGKIEEGILHHKKSLEYCEKSLGAEHPYTSIMRLRIGDDYRIDAVEHNKALPYLIEGCKGLALSGELKCRLYLIVAFLRVATAYLEIGNLKEAREYLAKAKQACLIYNPDLVDWPHLYLVDAYIYMAQDELLKSKESFYRAYSKLDTVRGEIIANFLRKIKIYNSLAQIEAQFHNYSAAYILFEKSLAEAKKVYGGQEHMQIAVYLVSFAQTLLEGGNISAEVRTLLERALAITEKVKQSELKVKIYTQLGNYYLQNARYDSALYFSQNALALQEQMNFRQSKTTLQNLLTAAQAYERKGELEKAQDFLARCQYVPTIGTEKWEARLAFANFFARKNKYEPALSLIDKALDTLSRDSTPLSLKPISQFLGLKSQIKIAQNELNQAFGIVQDILARISRDSIRRAADFDFYLLQLARIAAKQARLTFADSILQRVLILKPSGRVQAEAFALANELAQKYLEAEQASKAESAIQAALTLNKLSGSSLESNNTDNTEIENRPFFSYAEATRSFLLYAKAAQAQWDKSPASNFYFEKSLAYLQQASFMFQKTLERIEQETDRLNLAAFSEEIAQTALTLLRKKHKQKTYTPTDSLPPWEDFLFRLINRHKAPLFDWARKEKTAARDNPSLNAVLQKRKTLQLQLFQLQKDYLAIENSTKIQDSIKKQNLLRNIIALRVALDSLQQTIHKVQNAAVSNSASFREYQNFYPGVAEVQTYLRQTSSALAQYFHNDTLIYIFCLTPSGYTFFSIPISSLFWEQLQDYITFQNNKPFIKPITLGRFQNFIAKGYALYQALWQPIEPMPENRLLCMLSGKLQNLNFETLITEKKEIPYLRYDLVPFLVYRYNFCYGLSLQSLIDCNVRSSKTDYDENLVAFAPVFADQNVEQRRGMHRKLKKQQAKVSTFRSILEFYEKSLMDKGYSPIEGLGAIPFTLEEAREAAKLYRAQNKRVKVFTHQNATEKQFKQTVEQKRVQILEIASHALLWEESAALKHADNPDFSCILFYPDTNLAEDGMLYTGEVYRIPLDVDLVILSACKTALGKLYKGESFIGLLRAFSLAGARHICASLWSVDDAATKLLMIAFHKSVLERNDYVLSLNRAKREMIQKGKGHPFYWAAFVLAES
jgi:CHAT domain-containing protein/tetratricopeptide (TPR) repeat protein